MSGPEHPGAGGASGGTAVPCRGQDAFFSICLNRMLCHGSDDVAVVQKPDEDGSGEEFVAGEYLC